MRVSAKKINSKDKVSIETLINHIATTDYKANYYEPVLDGVNWTFILKIQNIEKKIRFDNARLTEFEELIRLLNNSLHNSKKYISMKIFK